MKINEAIELIVLAKGRFIDDAKKYEALHMGKEALTRLQVYEDIGLTSEEIKVFLSDFGISLLMENRTLKNQKKENEEIISKMANRLKAYEKNTFNSVWIPVSERLPNEEECSIYDDMHPNFRMFICTIKIEGYELQTRILFYSPAFGWIYGADDYNKYVVAWKPLPEPYEED